MCGEERITIQKCGRQSCADSDIILCEKCLDEHVCKKILNKVRIVHRSKV